MFKSKHSGWTWDLRRTPFGGGGSWSPADPFKGAGDALASIDPGPAIGSGLAEVDTFVNREIPGGWALPAALAVAYATGYFDPSLFAAEGAATTGAGGLAGGGAFVPAAGSGASFLIPEGAAYAVGAGLGSGAAVYGTTEGALQVGNLAYSNALANGATAAEANAAAEAATQTYMTTGYQGAAGTGNLLPSVSGEIGSNLAPSVGNFGSITAPSAGAITNGAGLTGAMGAGTIVGDGTLGTTIGQTYMAAGPGQFALDASGAAIPAGAGGIAGTVPSAGFSASDLLTNANRAKNIAKLLTGSEQSKIFGKNLPTANEWATQAAQNFAQATPEQFGGLYQMNKNPFTFANPLASALKGGTSGLDVSGSGGTTLQSQNLAKLLA
jgi:hypothetical protein